MFHNESKTLKKEVKLRQKTNGTMQKNTVAMIASCLEQYCNYVYTNQTEKWNTIHPLLFPTVHLDAHEELQHHLK